MCRRLGTCQLFDRNWASFPSRTSFRHYRLNCCDSNAFHCPCLGGQLRPLTSSLHCVIENTDSFEIDAACSNNGVEGNVFKKARSARTYRTKMRPTNSSLSGSSYVNDAAGPLLAQSQLSRHTYDAPKDNMEPSLSGRSQEISRLKPPQVIYLARHGETVWSLSGQHTGVTDLPLTPRGECNARRLGERLNGLEFARVLTSPLQRARRTCELTGFGAMAEVDADLVEWNYGKYEGLRTADIHAKRPEWDMFRDGFPGGESFDVIAARADRVVARVRSIDGAVLLFSSGHFLRVLAARWLGLKPQLARCLLLNTASLSTLTYEHSPSQPAIGLWNDTNHT